TGFDKLVEPVVEPQLRQGAPPPAPRDQQQRDGGGRHPAPYGRAHGRNQSRRDEPQPPGGRQGKRRLAGDAGGETRGPRDNGSPTHTPSVDLDQVLDVLELPGADARHFHNVLDGRKRSPG